MKQSRSKFLKLLGLVAAGSIIPCSKLLANFFETDRALPSNSISPQLTKCNDYAVYPLPAFILFHGAKPSSHSIDLNIDFENHFKGYYLFWEK